MNKSTATPQIVYCTGNQTQEKGCQAVFIVEANGMGKLNYQWYHEGKIIPGWYIAIYI